VSSGTAVAVALTATAGLAGAVQAAVMGEPKFPYYAEWEFEDMDAFKSAARTEEFMATGKDAMDMGVPFHVHFAEVE
jgi:hypothetical protein